MQSRETKWGRAALCGMALLLSGCGGGSTDESVAVDGSSTVFPISEALAEEFRNEQPQVRVTVGLAGTGGGFKKFMAGEIDICDASREITDDEAESCQERGIEFLELTVAYDGLVVVVHPENDWCQSLTVDQLRELWRPESAVEKWSDLNPDWPDESIHLYGPGTDSGTFDYFTEVIVGTPKASRSDFTASEDDNVLVRGVESDRYALGYFGHAYYEENHEKLRGLGVDAGEGAVIPTAESVRDGSYQPLSRPLLIYVNRQSLSRPAVQRFVEFYLQHAPALATEVGYVAAPPRAIEENARKLAESLAILADKTGPAQQDGTEGP